MKKFVIVEHTIFLHEEKMKKICLLSISCLMLSGCFGSTDEYDMYAQNSLRAPVRPPVENKIEHKTVHKTSELPQSITQPVAVNTSGVNSPVVPQTSPQQPLVQTIVIPQYAPTPPVYPYAQPTAYGTTAMPYGAVQQLTIPAQSAMLGGIPQVQNPAPVQQNVVTSIPKPKIKKETVTVVSQPKEAVYPSWASSDYTPPVTVTSTDAMVTFKNPHRDETVQCASIDVMCIASYQQQGYKRVSPHKTGLEDEDTQGYPKTKWKADNSIPRW